MSNRPHISPIVVRGSCYVLSALLSGLVASLSTDHRITLVGALSTAVATLNALRAFLDVSSHPGSDVPNKD